jgi:3-dehydroquinate dehydratase
MKVINLAEFKNQKKNQTWLYKISFHELFDEFIATYHNFESNPESYEISQWLDQVSDALNERFFVAKSEKISK